MNNQHPIWGEDTANVLTHSLGLLFFLIGTPFLIYKFATQTSLVVATSIVLFSLSLIMVYLSSTIYHSVKTEKRKRTFQIIDHICIYFLIAGTHTPLVFMYMNHSYGWIYVAFLWLCVLAGVFYKIFLIGRYQRLSLALYILMGWSAVITLPFMYHAIPTPALALLTLGGLSYTLGTIFFVWEKLPYNHAIWHLFVIGGSLGHFLAFFYCIQ